jgi:hypothetical protein
MSSRRVYLHVGTPKSGTSYLQDKLSLNRDELQRQGLDYPRTRTGNHFQAALDLIGDTWAGEEKAARGRWDALAQVARRSEQDVLISHEILAAADDDGVARAMASFPEQEVHVVLTARDLGRQIPAEWQERIKHRGGRDYATFLKALERNYGRTDWMMWFWRVQHLPHVLATWRASLPPDRVHLVTVPPAGGPRDALWTRFATVVGLDPQASYAESQTTNASLGGAEVTMLRRLNDALRDEEVTRPVYVHWVRESIVKEVLATRPGKVPATVPPRRRAAVEQITATWLEEIRASRVDVVGDLTDLVPVWPDDEGRWQDPDRADPEVVAEAAIEALAHVLARVGRKPVSDDDTGAVARLTRMLRS